MTSPALPPPPAHQLITLSGYKRNPDAVGSRLEEWSFSLKTAPDTAATAASMATRATAVRQAWTDHLRLQHSAATILERVVVAQVGATGKWLSNPDGSFAKGESNGLVDGGAVPAGNLPLQAALCVGLVTNRAGASGRGRFFLPWPDAHNITAEKVLSPESQTAIANACKAFIAAVEAASSPIRVFSGRGFSSDVTAIRVGRRPDTLRSRNDRVLESYLTVALGP